MREMEAARHLRRMENVLILTHVRPDGDTVGCAAALCLALRKLGKTAYLLPNPGVTENTAPYVTPYEAPLDFQPEYVVSVDIAATQLLPENAKMFAGQIELAIDHHPSFEHFGQQNIVRPEAGACGELVYDMPSLPDIQKYCAAQVDTLWDEVQRFDNPHTYYVDLSQKLWDIKYALLKSNGR